MPKLVTFSVQLCGIQETEEGSDTRYFKQLSICSKTRLKVKVFSDTNNVMNYKSFIELCNLLKCQLVQCFINYNYYLFGKFRKSI